MLPLGCGAYPAATTSKKNATVRQEINSISLQISKIKKRLGDGVGSHGSRTMTKKWELELELEAAHNPYCTQCFYPILRAEFYEIFDSVAQYMYIIYSILYSMFLSNIVSRILCKF